MVMVPGILKMGMTAVDQSMTICDQSNLSVWAAAVHGMVRGLSKPAHHQKVVSQLFGPIWQVAPWELPFLNGTLQNPCNTGSIRLSPLELVCHNNLWLLC